LTLTVFVGFVISGLTFRKLGLFKISVYRSILQFAIGAHFWGVHLIATSSLPLCKARWGTTRKIKSTATHKTQLQCKVCTVVTGNKQIMTLLPLGNPLPSSSCSHRPHAATPCTNARPLGSGRCASARSATDQID